MLHYPLQGVYTSLCSFSGHNCTKYLGSSFKDFFRPWICKHSQKYHNFVNFLLLGSFLSLFHSASRTWKRSELTPMCSRLGVRMVVSYLASFFASKWCNVLVRPSEEVDYEGIRVSCYISFVTCFCFSFFNSAKSWVSGMQLTACRQVVRRLTQWWNGS